MQHNHDEIHIYCHRELKLLALPPLKLLVLASNSFIPLILQPARITSHSCTLIDNILSNVIDPHIILGNLTATISDHLPQFSIIANMFGNVSGNKLIFMKGAGLNLIKKILF